LASQLVRAKISSADSLIMQTCLLIIHTKITNAKIPDSKLVPKECIMQTIEFFKLQAKNLHKDFKTQKLYFDSTYDRDLYEYAPKFFDIEALLNDFDIDENNFTLMNAQHIIAKVVGFDKWTDMVKASPAALELAKLLFDNLHKITNEEWEYYVLNVENENDIILDDEFKLEIFKTAFADVDGHQTTGFDYRLANYETPLNENQIITPRKKKKKNTAQIYALPLVGANLKKAIEVANWKFEDLLQMMEPRHPELISKLWNPEKWIDEVLKPDMLPIERDYALSLIEAFLVHHFIELDTEADKQGLNLN